MKIGSKIGSKLKPSLSPKNNKQIFLSLVTESDAEESKPEESEKSTTLAPPTVPPPTLANFGSISSHLVPSESVYESAAKLLFMSIKWAKSVPSFLQLQESDQTQLLEESWAQLFIIGLAQWTIRFDEGMCQNCQLLRARLDSSAHEIFSR